MINNEKKVTKDYSKFKTKMLWHLLSMVGIAILIFIIFYMVIWKGKGSDWIVSLMQNYLYLDEATALHMYRSVFRNNVDIIVIVSIVFIFLILLYFFMNWFTRYFNAINDGIEALLQEGDKEIVLPAEMVVVEDKLNAVKNALIQRELAAQVAEQRKNDLVMYLAHDIRTPLTSVIGYLSLLEEAPDMPAEQKAKYVHITLEKAFRLEKMIGEFFEITRYNLQQIIINKEKIDLYYMLIQLIDELTPAMHNNENSIELLADENLYLYGDADKLARVFNNVLRNAIAYSYKKTRIIISVEKQNDNLIIIFKNQGDTIPKQKLDSLFDKFFRMDEARTSNTGGTGLGLAIAKEIVVLHGGNIVAHSENEEIEFVITLPIVT